MAFPNRAKQWPAWSVYNGQRPLQLDDNHIGNGWKSPLPSILNWLGLGVPGDSDLWIGRLVTVIIMDEMTTKWLISNSGSTSLTVQTFFRFHLRILCFQLAVEESTREKFLNWYPSELHPWHLVQKPQRLGGWTTNPFGKISWSNWIISHRVRGWKLTKNVWNLPKVWWSFVHLGRGGNPNVIGSFRRGIWYIWEGLNPHGLGHQVPSITP